MIRTLKLIFFCAACAGFAGAAGLAHLGFSLYPPLGVKADGSRVAFQKDNMAACLQARLFGLAGDHGGRAYWTECAGSLATYGALNDVNRRIYGVVGLGGLGIVSLLFFALALRLARPSAKIVRGPCLYTGRTARKRLSKDCRTACCRSGVGISLLPGMSLSRDQETLHHLIWGGVGGGKTQTMLRYILEASRRGDALLVLDTKGDMMAHLPGEPLLIAPHDARSLVWDVAADCRTRQDARELAARFIPESHDQMWSNAAREIFVACIVSLQATRGPDWGWPDLHEVVTRDVDSLTDLARDYHPDALRNLSPPDSKTTQSTLATFQAHMTMVAIFAEAWGDKIQENGTREGGTRGRFSIRAWLHNPPAHRPLILQHDPAYPDLSRIWVGSMVSFLASMVGSPALGESRDRRIWLFLDEFPQLPPIRNFTSLIELGRSKGVITVLGVQDLAQLRAAYGRELAGAWPGMIGTKIITRINMSASAEEASRMVGDHDVERKIKNVSLSHREESRRVITGAEIATRLGPQKSGIRILFMGVGADVHQIDLPYISLPRLREGMVPADWTQRPPTKNSAAQKTPQQAAQGPAAGPRLSAAQADNIKAQNIKAHFAKKDRS